MLAGRAGGVTSWDLVPKPHHCLVGHARPGACRPIPVRKRTVDTTMTHTLQERELFAGVDTHADTHHGAVVDTLGRQLGDREFTSTPHGYRVLLTWIGGLASYEPTVSKGGAPMVPNCAGWFAPPGSRRLKSTGATGPAGEPMAATVWPKPRRWPLFCLVYVGIYAATHVGES